MDTIVNGRMHIIISLVCESSVLWCLRERCECHGNSALACIYTVFQIECTDALLFGFVAIVRSEDAAGPRVRQVRRDLLALIS